MNSFFQSIRRFIVLAALLGHVAGAGLHALEHARHAEPASTACSDARDGHLHEGAALSHAPAHDCVQCQRSSGAAPELSKSAAFEPAAPSNLRASASPLFLSSSFLPAAPRRGPPPA